MDKSFHCDEELYGPQVIRCPEAEFWNSGDLAMIGKGDRFAYYLVARKFDRTSVVAYYRGESE